MRAIAGSALVVCALLCMTVLAAPQSRVDAFALNERQGDRWGWAVNYETVCAGPAAEALGQWTEQLGELRYEAEAANALHGRAMETSAAVRRTRFDDVHELVEVVAAAAAGASSDVPLRAALVAAQDSLVALRARLSESAVLVADEAGGGADPAAPVADDAVESATADSMAPAERVARAAEPDGAPSADAAGDGVADGARVKRSGRIPGLLGILVAIVWWAVRRNSTKPRFRRTASDQKNWLEMERWRR